MKFSVLDRKEIVSRLCSDVYDVLVIGGGITGAGIALDAAARGMKTALVEMQDFAAGTSSRSTKLVHGGLRYLKQLEVKLVAEVGKEREIVFENGPHVTKPEWMLLPILKGGTFGRFSTAFGLSVYDFLAGVKKSERRTMLSREETLLKEPLLRQEHLIGSGYYVEYRTDDARLTLEVLKAADEMGAVVCNYSKLLKLIYENGLVAGVEVEDQLSGKQYQIKAKKVVNATGPWIEEIQELDQSKGENRLRLTKGVHLVIDNKRFPLTRAVYFDTEDGRMVFAIPREGKAYVGTTDTFYYLDKAKPYMTTKDASYLIRAVNYMFPNQFLTEADIESSWAGIRPLIFQEGKKASEISRKDEIWDSKTGLITIAGGKLTGYRKMAEDVVNLLSEKFINEEGISYPRCKTKKLPISGGNVGGSEHFNTFIESKTDRGIASGLNYSESVQLTSMYGSNIDKVFELFNNHKKEAEKYRLPSFLFAQLVYAIHYEMAATPCDFFNRRIGAILFNIDFVQKWKVPVIAYMSETMGWSEEKKQRYTDELETVLLRSANPIDEE
ncbi:glycerol-3-phosphate dehydrogenase/oxidase [Neobacillus sp. FSL H8-0543]|uniref:glycerol-3-phosphate dehydrogenase/oxidase n=1 Tax=Neobacillus sp. FSL H8-0543 TaxID=2954672 RepID=UPI003158D4E8